MVAVKDMEMPKSCEECRIHICAIIDKNIDYEYASEIHPNCPLVEVITCKDCEYRVKDMCTKNEHFVDDNFYCMDAKRRE